MEFVTDSFVKGLFSSVIKKYTGRKYNTDETVIGEWIDGRPIYRKVLTDIAMPQCSSNGTVKYTDTDISECDIDIVINMYGVMGYSGSSTKIIPFSNYNGAYSAEFIYNPSTKMFRLGNSSKGLNTHTVSYICIEYTKTSDITTDE